MKLTHKIGALLFGTVLLAAAAPFDAFLKVKNQQKLGEQINAYLEAIASKEDTTDIREKLLEAFAKHDKKINKKSEEEFNLLTSGEDLKAMFAFSQVYPKRSAAGKMTQFSQDTPLDQPVKYALHAPKGYKASKGTLPLILVIPEEHEVLAKGAKEPEKQLDEDWMLKGLRNNAVIASVEMPTDPSLWSIRGMEVMGGVEAVFLALRQIRYDYAIDADKIFLAGHGAGVAAAIDIASTYPHIFAGVIGRSGDVNGTSPANFGNLPTFFAGGGSGVSKFEEEAKELGIENVNVSPAGLIEDVWTWIQETKRNGNPAKVTYSPTSANGNAYWIVCDGFEFETDDRPEIVAEIDRSSNVIAISSKGISSVTLMLNDQLVDLGSEVVVIANGVEYKNTFTRSLPVAVNQFYRTNDPGRIYTAFQLYDLPTEDESEE